MFFICLKLNSHYPRILCAKFDWNGRVVLKTIFQVRQSISLLSPLLKGRGPSFGQTWIPFTQGCFVPSFVEISLVILEKWSSKVCQCIFAISLLSPLGNRKDPSFEQKWIPLTQGFFVPKLLDIGPVVLEKRVFKVCQSNFFISISSPLGKGRGPLFEKKMLCAKFGWNWPTGSGEEDVKRFRTANKFWSEKFTWDFASGEQKIQNKCAYANH